MPALGNYKGIQIAVPDPINEGGLAIQNDLKFLTDWGPKSEWGTKSYDPGAGDDIGGDYYPGSMWLNLTASPPKLFLCESSATLAAVWVPVLMNVEVDGADVVSITDAGMEVTALGVGAAPVASNAVQISAANLTGTDQIGIENNPTFGTDCSDLAIGYESKLRTADSSTAYATSDVINFRAATPTLGSNSSVSAMIGFLCNPLSAATSNVGFYGQLDAGANNYNCYMQGKAFNYFQGKTCIGGPFTTSPLGQVEVRFDPSASFVPQIVASYDGSNYTSMSVDSAGVMTLAPTGSGASLKITTTSTSGANQFGVVNSPTFSPSCTTLGVGYTSNLTTANSSTPYSTTELAHFRATTPTLGTNSSVGTLIGFLCNPLSAATANIGFYGQLDSGADNYNCYMQGKAFNYFQGKTCIGGPFTTSPLGQLEVRFDPSASFVPQIVASYDSSNYLAVSVSSTGDVAMSVTGSAPSLLVDFQLPGTSKATLDTTGKFSSVANTIRLQTSKTPSNSSDSGNAGDICWDSSYIYVCVATNTWKRAAIATW